MVKDKKDKKSKEEESGIIKIDKVRIWQIIALVLGLGIIYLFFSNIGGDKPAPQAPIQPTQQPQRIDISEDNDPVLGDPNAPVTIVSFEDYQCPFCGKSFAETFPRLKSDYINTGKVKYVYRDFPLTSIHPEALPAAEASECADDQEKFWEYHDLLFINQANLGTQLYAAIANTLGLDFEQFAKCMASGKHREEVQNDFNYGASVGGVSGTPTFFINGIKLVGAQPYEAFKQVIDAELAK